MVHLKLMIGNKKIKPYYLKNQYWDKKNVKLDKVNYKVIKDLQAGASLYDTESVDDAVITADQVNKYKDNKGLNFVLTTGIFVK